MPLLVAPAFCRSLQSSPSGVCKKTIDLNLYRTKFVTKLCYKMVVLVKHGWNIVCSQRHGCLDWLSELKIDRLIDVSVN